MELSVRSWSRPENAEELIGRKKVDLSVLDTEHISQYNFIKFLKLLMVAFI